MNLAAAILPYRSSKILVADWLRAMVTGPILTNAQREINPTLPIGWIQTAHLHITIYGHVGLQ